MTSASLVTIIMYIIFYVIIASLLPTALAANNTGDRLNAFSLNIIIISWEIIKVSSTRLNYEKKEAERKMHVHPIPSARESKALYYTLCGWK